MIKNFPKITALVVVILLLSLLEIAPIEAFVAVGLIIVAFTVDMTLFWFMRHNTVLEWLIDHVHITNKDMGQSDAPESIRKLILRSKEDDNHESIE
jgi:hypothetical protein